MSNPEFPVQGYYVFNSAGQDPITGFESVTRLRVNRCDVVTIPIDQLEEMHQPKYQKSWWDSFWDDGWSHLTFGTVSTAFGVGILMIATGPVGWATAVLAIGGGAIGAFSGAGQLLSTNRNTQQLFAEVGDVSLSFNNIPGLAVGTGTLVFTDGDINRSVNNANIAGLVSGGYSLARNGTKALRSLRQFSLDVSHIKTSWTPTMRKINARIAGVDPKGLEASHLIPQRIVKKIVQRVPTKLKKPVEIICNSPLCITFMKDTEHALVDSYRFQMLPRATKEILREANPFITPMIERYPKIADGLGFFRNLSPTARPVVKSLVITSGRGAKVEATNSSRR